MNQSIRLFKTFFLLGLVSLFSGCVYLIIGGIGALGGYVVSPDTVEGVAEVDDTEVWETTLDVLTVMGVVIEKYESAGLVKARVSNAKVTITIGPLNENTTKITVKARRYNLPRISTAQDVFVKIMTNLNAGKKSDRRESR